MTARQAKLRRKREIEKRNMARWLFRNTVKLLIVALAEIAAAGYMLLMKSDSYMINAWEMLFVFAAGVVAAVLLWKE